MRAPILLLASLSILASTAHSADDWLQRDAYGSVHVVVSPAASPSEHYAASEFKKYWRMCTGHEPADGPSPMGGNTVWIGRDGVPAKLLREFGLDGLGPDGLHIKSVGADLLIVGGQQRGTMYGVYEFFQRYMGVRWLAPDCTHVPPAPLSLPHIDFRYVPVFEWRTISYRAFLQNPWFAAVHRLNGQHPQIPEEMGGHIAFANGFGHTFHSFVSPDEYGETHPEYFLMNADGSPHPQTPNFTHPGAVEIAAGIIKEHFRKNPASNGYGFALHDGPQRDYSPETMNLNQGFTDLYWGSPTLSITEEWITFVNNVTAEVRREFPDVYIATNGYLNREAPPQGVILDDHLVIMYAPIWSCTLHAYDDDSCWMRKREGQMLKRWAEMCDNVWVYGYNHGMLVSALTPVPMVHKLRRDFPLMKEWGVMGFYDQTRFALAECSMQGRYIRAKLEWNANADVDALLDDFYAKWYGSAAKPMRAFYDALENAIEETPMHGHEDRILPEVYTPELMGDLDRQIITAEELADTEREKLHVRADRLIYEHLRQYMAVRADEAAGDFAAAARDAQRMLDLRAELHEIHLFFIMPDEGWAAGIWYYGVTDRRDYFQSLADRMSGKTGDLVALLPDTAMFRTDPHDDGRFAEWYKPDLDQAGWKPIQTTRPFYVQGYQDEQGHPYVGHIWYRLNVDVPASAEARKVMLYASIVESEAWCWVNGEYIGHRPHRDSYVRPLAIDFDVTDAIQRGETNQITIRVSTGLSEAQVAGGLMSRLFLYSPIESRGTE